MTTGAPESRPPEETVGIAVHFDFTGTPEERMAAEQRMHDAAQAVGGTCITTEVMQMPLALERCLDGRFDWLLADLPPHNYAKSHGSLFSQGFRSVRDLWVMGAARLQTLGEVGPKALDSIRAHAEASPALTIPLKDKPTVEDMAAWCSDTNLIPAQVVMPWGGFHNGRYQYVKGRVSVEDAAANTELFQKVGGSPRSSELAQELIADFRRLKAAQRG
jgi:hypothetical protein